ncbi:hypothetical protein QQY24_01605 [Streptomyces sp. TG1A-8]|uniref:hypothetical protein n=1 Tax=Streptomyces sp. TG1A-8 TaxID=3051385 RepID=UPI00265C12AC|nr:hypothetical protein [Streptomyces sp. TG1A-8]MDO0924175.1 hypothetical protein [Streptomyces sp. TG1A-8]
MAEEPEKTTIQNVYAQRYAADLAANRTEQGELIERLEQLKADEAWLERALANVPGAVTSPSGAGPAAGPDEEPTAPGKGRRKGSAPAGAGRPAPVPQPRQDGQGEAAPSEPVAEKAVASKGKAPVERTTVKKTAARRRSTAKKAPAKKAPAKKTSAADAPAGRTADKAPEPPLHELVLGILLKAPGEPHMTREVRTRLEQDHPGRTTTMQTVRNTLEALAKKGRIDKSNQQGSVMYTAFAGADAAPGAGNEAGPAPAGTDEEGPAEG